MDQLNTIEKSGKDRTLLENWRPISLVIVDTKIMSKVIAARVKKVLPSIIHYNQTGYVKDRFIGEAIRSIFDIMDFTAKENIKIFKKLLIVWNGNFSLTVLKSLTLDEISFNG